MYAGCNESFESVLLCRSAHQPHFPIFDRRFDAIEATSKRYAVMTHTRLNRFCLNPWQLSLKTICKYEFMNDKSKVYYIPAKTVIIFYLLQLDLSVGSPKSFFFTLSLSLISFILLLRFDVCLYSVWL